MKARGEAKGTLELKDGFITMTHGYDGSMLFRFRAKEGDWEAIHATIENIGMQRRDRSGENLPIYQRNRRMRSA
jgi:hypothetical protein